MPDTDAALVLRARQGDESAFEVLVRRHLKSCFAVALARVGQPADAEDVVQDAFVNALQKLESCRSPEKFGSWLLEIVRNRAHNYRRYQAVRDALPLSDSTIAAGNEDPLRDTERSELKENLLKALEGLTVLQREVILLFDLEGWRHREIAEKLGISEGSARVHLSNARRALRLSLGTYNPEAN
ncbi:MAG: sigma-70 family RNA polymerase sigma factor [Gemmatimonadota bacterium]